MHTKVPHISACRAPASVAVEGIVGLLLTLLPVLAAPAVGQPTFPGASDTPSVNLRVYPADLWGPRAGPGVGMGLVGHNLVRRNDQWLLTGAPALREQVVTASFASANPRRARRYVLLSTRALHTDVDWLGPPGRRTVLERSSVRADVRLGQSFLAHRLLLQPRVAVSHHLVDTVNQPANPLPLAPFLPSSGSERTGLRAGLDVQLDTRNGPVLSTRGLLLQGAWNRYVSLDDSALRFDQLDLRTHVYVPLGGLHRLATRIALTITEARSNIPIPVYMLPTLGGATVPGWARSRFVGPDRLMGSVLYRFPVLRFGKFAVVEGHVGTHLAGSYDDLGDEFVTSVSFEDTRNSESSSHPLRPAASVGLRFAMPSRPHAVLEFAVGASPEGVSAVRFSFVRSLQALRPPHHSPETL